MSTGLVENPEDEMGNVLDLKSYAEKLRARDRVAESKPHRRDGATAEIHIWDGIRIDRFAIDQDADLQMPAKAANFGPETALS